MSNTNIVTDAARWKSYMENAGWKSLPDQLTIFPFVRHLLFGDKKDLPIPESHQELISLVTYLSNNKHIYQQFLRQKGRHPSYDIYACFQPFNEAFKALYPFVQLIKNQLRPGDCILNLWDRSGWTAAMLAGWFPRQHIITVWEGDKDVLGYRGFDYWMSAERRLNHTVLFSDFNRPLPLENASIAAIVGFDVLHRFYQPEMLTGLCRIAKPGAPMLFPHVHLTNNMPEPFFERGCRQLHGTDYQFFFNGVSNILNRKGYVLSEPETFAWNDTTTETNKILISKPDHTDYNACIAWLPSAIEQTVLQPWRGHEQSDWEQMYLLQNPLLIIDPVTSAIKRGGDDWGYSISEFLERHPVYAAKIKKSIGMVIDEDFRCVLYWALQGLRLSDIIQKTKISRPKLQEFLSMAWETDLAQVVPVDEAGFRLQTLLGHQKYLPEVKECQLSALWKQAVALYGSEKWCKMPEEEAVTYGEADELIQLIRKALSVERIKKGDKILICGEMHIELLLIFWAAVISGVVVVPISSKQADLRISEYIELIRPSIAIVEPALFTVLEATNCPRVIMTDAPSDPGFREEHSFGNWLEQALEKEVSLIHPELKPDDQAVILWTTGSTNNPKAIPVTHAQLLRSGRMMTESYHWKKTDSYYALGGLETMSGLRHATVCLAEAGTSCLIPVKGGNIFDHLDAIGKEKITILTANPAFYKQLLLAAKTKGKKPLHSVRLALSTGNRLSGELRQFWQHDTGYSLYNYYGLTETTGICIAELPGSTFSDNSIGVPVDCLVKVLDQDGRPSPTGMPGELCIYGAGVFTGYYNNQKATEKVLDNGWFHTGDLVIQEQDGSLSLCGRLSDIVKLPSGDRIEIGAIEEVLKDIAGLQDWAVCPVREDEKEYVAVFVVAPREGMEEICNLVRPAIINAIGFFALPALIKCVDSIPRGNHNKVLRNELLEHYFTALKQS